MEPQKITILLYFAGVFLLTLIPRSYSADLKGREMDSEYCKDLPNGYHGHPTNCDKYIMCDRGKATEMTCEQCFRQQKVQTIVMEGRAARRYQNVPKPRPPPVHEFGTVGYMKQHRPPVTTPPRRPPPPPPPAKVTAPPVAPAPTTTPKSTTIAPAGVPLRGAPPPTETTTKRSRKLFLTTGASFSSVLQGRGISGAQLPSIPANGREDSWKHPEGEQHGRFMHAQAKDKKDHNLNGPQSKHATAKPTVTDGSEEKITRVFTAPGACEPGQMTFSDISGRCVSEVTATCKVGPNTIPEVRPHPEKIADNFCKDKQQGNHRYPGSCHRYISCNNGRILMRHCPHCEQNPKSCPSGLLNFNPKSGDCDMPANVSCVEQPAKVEDVPVFGDEDEDPTHYDVCLDRGDGNYAHADTCIKYISCSSDVVQVRDCPVCTKDPATCPEGRLFYSEKHDACLSGVHVECANEDDDEVAKPS